MLTKSQLSALLHDLGIAVGEGVQFLVAKGEYPKVAYWESVWMDDTATGEDYEEIVGYKVGFASMRPRDPKLVELKRRLNEMDLHPTIHHEYIEMNNTPGYYYSELELEVVESIIECV